MPDESRPDQPDPRWRAAQFADGTNWVFGVEPVRFDDGQVIHLPENDRRPVQAVDRA